MEIAILFGIIEFPWVLEHRSPTQGMHRKQHFFLTTEKAEYTIPLILFQKACQAPIRRPSSARREGSEGVVSEHVANRPVIG